MLAAIIITLFMFLFSIVTTKIAMDGAIQSGESELKELQNKYEGLKVS